LAYALAGYNPIAEEVIAAFKLYVQEEARDYEKEFLLNFIKNSIVFISCLNQTEIGHGSSNILP
jgi:hypothetical protein